MSNKANDAVTWNVIIDLRARNCLSPCNGVCDDNIQALR